MFYPDICGDLVLSVTARQLVTALYTEYVETACDGNYMLERPAELHDIGKLMDMWRRLFEFAEWAQLSWPAYSEDSEFLAKLPRKPDQSVLDTFNVLHSHDRLSSMVLAIWPAAILSPYPLPDKFDVSELAVYPLLEVPGGRLLKYVGTGQIPEDMRQYIASRGDLVAMLSYCATQLILWVMTARDAELMQAVRSRETMIITCPCCKDRFPMPWPLIAEAIRESINQSPSVDLTEMHINMAADNNSPEPKSGGFA